MTPHQQRVEATPTPALLIWARESMGLDVEQAADMIRVKSARLAEWESGARNPSMPQLRKVAEAYKRPLALFYLSAPPQDLAPPPDFRRGDAAIRRPSPHLVLAIRQAHAQREMALDLAASIGIDVRAFDHRLPSEHAGAEAAARAVRDLVGVTDEAQAGWRNSYEALAWWRGAVESLGALTIQVSKVSPAEMRGFSIFEPRLPVVAVNSADAPNGRIFSLLHELVHLLTRSGGLCAFDESDLGATSVIERRCNEIAGAVLVPTEILLLEAATISKAPDDEDLKRLGRRFSVSSAVVVRRMFDLKLVSHAVYRARMAAYAAMVYPKSGGPVPIERRTIARLGHRCVRLALDAQAAGALTEGEVADVLGVKVNYIDRVAARLAAMGIDAGDGNDVDG